MRDSVTLVCPTCNNLFNVLEDEAVKGMECLQCGYLDHISKEDEK